MSMTEEPQLKSPSRRAILAGVLGGVGAWAASTMNRLSPVRAEGQAVVVGGEYTDATSATSITNMANTEPAYLGSSQAGGVGVQGMSNSGRGVWGLSGTGQGVVGVSSSYLGVHGASFAVDQPALVGRGLRGSTGVMGYSTDQDVFDPVDLPTAPPGTGVFGQAAEVGVWGYSPGGRGVHGASNSGWAGHFEGAVLVATHLTMREMKTPTAPADHYGRLFFRNNGSGKTQLCVRFHTGRVKVLATES